MNIARNKNPNINRLINPSFNRMINPNFNRMINPGFNRMINPNFNRMINPGFNRMINPNFNRMTNPSFNRMINPNYNRAINPNHNRAINPNYNPLFDGYLVFNLSSEVLEFIINTESDIILFYTENLEHTRFGIKHDQEGFVLFDNELKFKGHIEHDSQDGYNEFDIDNNWVSYIK